MYVYFHININNTIDNVLSASTYTAYEHAVYCMISSNPYVFCYFLWKYHF
jgi:hypothetical protein